MTVIQCSKHYTRVFEGAPQHVRCTYVDGHAAECSFRTLQMEDAAEARLTASGVIELPTHVKTLVVDIGLGSYDPYIEILLNNLHNRKRNLRGERGFGSVRRGA